MSRRPSSTRRNSETGQTPLQRVPSATIPQGLSWRSASSASRSSVTLPRRLSGPGWVFDQDYWRGSEKLAAPKKHKRPIVVVIRHAEALHNVRQATAALQRKLDATIDPPLTSLGIKQAASVQTRYPNLCRAVQAGKRVKVVSSPLLRTLQTTYTAFPFLQAGDVVLAPDLQEGPDWSTCTGSAPCDLVLKLNAVYKAGGGGRTFAASHFSALSVDWYRKEGPYTFEAQAILKRNRRIRRYIRSLDLDLVVVVTHQGVIPGFCKDRLYRDIDATSWHNTEARAYTFDPADMTETARLLPLSASESAAVLGIRKPSFVRTSSKTSLSSDRKRMCS